MSINRVELLGNLGGDPDLRHTGKGTPVATMSVATSRKFTKKDTGEVIDEREWHRVVIYGPAAESVARFKKKGDQIFVEGHLRTRKYDDREGVTRWTTEVISGHWGPGGVTFVGRVERAAAHPAENPGSSSAPPDNVPGPGDDDIPF